MAVRAWIDSLVTDPAIPNFYTVGDTLSDNDHRDYGDENDYDVVCGNGCSSCDSDEVNQTPIPLIDASVGINVDEAVSEVIRQGVAAGDFTLLDDGSVEPVIPEPGTVNKTWARVLLAELLLATGCDPDKRLDLLRDAGL